MAVTKPKKRTTDKIKSTLITMLETTPIENINVSELCRHAEINRANFYYHYPSVEAVFNDIETNLEQDFFHSISIAAASKGTTPEKSFYLIFFEFVANNAQACKMIINLPHGTNNSFLTRALQSGKATATGMVTSQFPACSAKKIDLYYTYTSNGFLGLLSYWLNNGMQESVEEIAVVGEKLARSSSQFLFDEQM